MSPHFAAQVVVDALYAAKIITEQNRKEAFAYINSIPGYLRLEDYPEWRAKKVEDGAKE